VPTTPTKPPATPPVESRFRFWKWAKRLFLGLLLVVVAYAVLVWGERQQLMQQGNRELAPTIADIDRTDPDWRWDALNAKRKRAPDGKNSAELIPRIRNALPPEWGNKLLDKNWTEGQTIPVPNCRYPATVIAEARRELLRSSEAIELARTLRDLSWGHREIELTRKVIDTTVEPTQKTRLVAQLLRWDTEIALEDGNTPVAADDLLAFLNASRSIGDEPCIISQLIRSAVRGFATRSLERALAQSERFPRLEELQSAWAAEAEEPILLYALRGERAMHEVLGERMASGSISLSELVGDRPRDWLTSLENRVRSWSYQGHLPADRATNLRLMTEMVEAARLPLNEQPPAFARITIPPRQRERILTGLLVAPPTVVTPVQWRTAASMRAAVVGLACERYRLRQGRWPKTLDEIPRDLLASVPLDPFDGQPLRYRHTTDGVVVYSIGKNLIDDEGELSWNPAVSGADEGFRLWNPEARRQPAPPEPNDDDQP
jgi:hypothetical protein